MAPFDDRLCQLGEGPLWHPLRQQLFWFDILGKKLLTRQDSEPQEWQFDDYVSAAGWLDKTRLLIASETALFDFSLETGERRDVCALEADNAVTRSNDGRADPFGGFWIGTMGKSLEPEAGAIYRYFQGELRLLYDRITISNAISFSPDKRHAYFADTAPSCIYRVALDGDGWPCEEPQLFLDLLAENLNPDGAVVDCQGQLWVAQWGASRVAVYDSSGAFIQEVKFPASQISCPAFGGPELTDLYVTSARDGLGEAGLDDEPQAGKVFCVPAIGQGQAEYRVIL